MLDNQSPPVERLVVSRPHAAKMLDVCVGTIDNWVDAGRLEKIQLSTKRVGITMRSIRKLTGITA
jgi:predicted site-specific integrase-resolvase